MPIIRHSPFADIERFFDEEFPSFGFIPAVKRSMEPAMDVYQTEHDLIVELQVPKVDPKDIKVTVEDGVLKVEGGQESAHEEKGKEYFRREIRRGQFVRMLSLPVSVKEGETKATFEHGVLKVTLPKTEAVKAKVVEVEVK